MPAPQRQSKPQHVANPNTGMQHTAVGLDGIHNPKPITAHTENRKVKYRQKKGKGKKQGGWTAILTRFSCELCDVRGLEVNQY